MNALNWFEIPAQDFDRAVTFYEKLLQISMKRIVFGGDQPNGIFPYEEGLTVGGSVVLAPYAKPSADGAVIYLNARDEATLDHALAQVEALGGKIIMPKTDIGEVGSMALLLDSEGNRVGLHIPPSRN